MTREARVGILAVAGLGALVFFLLAVGSLGELREELDYTPVGEVLAGPPPADRFGDREVRIVGWYAELAADCVEPPAPAHAVPWIERTCPLRVLLPYQPSPGATQAQLLADGLRLVAPDGQAFPARARPEGLNLRLQQLVYVGHFADEAAESCVPERRDACRNAFVVSDYDGFIR